MISSPVSPEATGYVPHDHDSRKRWIIYVVAAVLVIVLLVVMVISYRGYTANQRALQKADALNAARSKAGLATVDREEIARTLGNDGGAICDTSHTDLGKAALKLGLINGATGPGIRPVTVAREVVQGEQQVLEIYCPQNLTSFDKLVHDLKYAGVIKN